MAPPQFRVSLNNNMVDGSAMTGGYSAWQLLPNGQVVAPVTEKQGPFTVTDADTLNMTGGNGKIDRYFCRVAANFKKDEVISITGPIPQGNNPAVIIMKGLTSTLQVNFEYQDN